MEANEWRIVIAGVLVTESIRDYTEAASEARNYLMTSQADAVTLQGRTVTPWRDVEIPFAEEVT